MRKFVWDMVLLIGWGKKNNWKQSNPSDMQLISMWKGVERTHNIYEMSQNQSSGKDARLNMRISIS